jgi:hypothetical protein
MYCDTATKASLLIFNTQIDSVGRAQRFTMLKVVTRIEPLGFQRLRRKCKEIDADTIPSGIGRNYII